MKLVDIKTATRRNLDDMCRSLDMNSHDYEIMVRWYHNSNEIWAGFCRDQLGCLYGTWAKSLLSDEAYLWLVTNEVVKEHPFIFVRHSQLAIERLLKQYRTLYGHVLYGQVNSIQWLEWLGVQLKRHEAENGLIPFELKRGA